MHPMRIVNYAASFRPLLLKSGIGLLFLYLLNLIFGLPSIPESLGDPNRGLRLITSFLDSSLLLIIALLMLVLSQADLAHPRNPEEQQHPTLQLRLFRLARPLVACVSLLFFACIPYGLIQGVTLVNIGLLNLDKETSQVSTQLEQVQNELKIPGAGEKFLAEFKQKYPNLTPLITAGTGDKKPLTTQTLNERVSTLLKKVRSDGILSKQTIQRDVFRRTKRVILYGLVYGSIVACYWNYWPRGNRSMAQALERETMLGLYESEFDGEHEDEEKMKQEKRSDGV